MKKKARPLQLVLTLLLILVFAYTAFFGVSARYGDVTRTYLKGAQDIRFGVDIQGGVNVVFVPSDGFDATEEQLDAAQLVIENRLVAMNLTDYELYKDVDADRATWSSLGSPARRILIRKLQSRRSAPRHISPSGKGTPQTAPWFWMAPW